MQEKRNGNAKQVSIWGNSVFIDGDIKWLLKVNVKISKELKMT